MFCVAEELIALITTCPFSMFNCNRLQGVQMLALAKKQLKMQNEGGGKSFMTADVSTSLKC